MATKILFLLFSLLLCFPDARSQTPAANNLLGAIMQNNLDSVRLMVEQGANVNASDSNNASMLMWAAYKADVRIVKYLVSKGADYHTKGTIYINEQKTSYYGNLTGIAAGEGKPEMLKFLVGELKINIDDKEFDNATKSETGWTALQWASSTGRLEIVKYLVENGAEINTAHTADKSTPLLYALQNKHPDVAQYLIIHGADVNRKYANGGTALMYAVLANDFESCVLLWQHKASLNDKADNGMTALALAMQKSPSRMVDFLKNPSAYTEIAKRNYWLEMKERFTRYHEEKESEKAIPYGARAFLAARSEKADTTKEYGLFLKEYATAHARIKNYDSADIYFAKARLAIKKHGEDKEYYSLLYLMQYYYESLTKQMDKAASVYDELLDIAKQISGEKDETYLKKLNESALFYEAWNKPEKALQYFSQATAVYKELYGFNSKQHAEQLEKLAKFYERSNRYDSALIFYNEVINIYHKSEDRSLEYYSAVSDLGKLYRKLKNYDLAIPLLKITSEQIKTLKGGSSEEYALSLNQLAIVFEYNKNYDSAVACYKNAISIIERINRESPNYTAVVRNLATLYESVNDYANAEIFYTKVAATKKKMFGIASKENITAIDELVNVYKTAKKYDAAISQYRDVLNSSDTLSGSFRSELLVKLAGVYENMNDTAQAEKNYLLAKYIAEKNNNTSEVYQTVLKALTGYYVRQNKFDDAEKLYTQMVTLEKDISGDTSEAYFDRLFDLGSFYDDRKQYSKAEPLYLQVTDFRLKTKGKESTSYAAMLNQIALMYKSDKQYRKAEDLFKVVTEIYRKKVGDEHEYYAITLTNQASLYEALGNYEKAIALYNLALNIQKKVFGEGHATYISSLKNISSVYSSSTQYDKAEPFYLELAAYYKTKFGESSPEYAASLNRLGLLYNAMAQYEKAELHYRASNEIFKKLNGTCEANCATIMYNMALMNKKKGAYELSENLFKEILAIRKKTIGENHEDYFEVLKNLASLYEATFQFDKAENIYHNQIALRAKYFGTETEEYASVLIDLAIMYNNSQRYDKGEELEMKALAIRKKLFGEQSTQYFSTIESLGNMYLLATRFDKVDSLCKSWLTDLKTKYGEDHPDFARVLDQQAQWYRYMGVNDKSEQYFSRAAAIYEKILGPENPSYIATLNNLAAFYVYMDQHAKAEVLYIKISEIVKRVWGERHPQYASSISRLGDLYLTLGLKSKAESYWIKVLDINRQNNGDENEATTLVMEKLAGLYKTLGQDDKGMQLAKRALEITGRILGKKNDAYANMLRLVASFHTKNQQYNEAETLLIEAVNINEKSGARAFYAFTGSLLADLYLATKEFDKAEKWYKVSLNAWVSVFGKTHIGYALGLNSLAKFYKTTGDNKSAEKLFRETINIYAASVGNDNKGLAIYLRNLAFFYEDVGNYAMAEPLLEQIKDIEIKDLLAVFANLSEKEKGIFVEEKITLNATLNSFLYSYPQAGKKFIRDNFNLQLLLKSLTLADTKNVMESVKNSTDPTIKQTYLNWQANKIILSKQYAMPVASRRADLQQIEEETENLEKKLAQMSTAFRDQQKALQLKLTDVQKGMQTDEAAIEFVRFSTYSSGKWTDSILYAAYILKKYDSVPVFLTLCEERQLQKLFMSAGKTTTAMVSSLYRGVGEEGNNVSISRGDSLYKLIWQPLEPYLEGINRISYSLVGKLHTVAFNALPVGDKVLMDKYELQQYASTRDIALRETNKITQPKNITLFGNPLFSMDSLALVTNAKSVPDFSGNIYVPSTRGNQNTTWSTLPGTAQEVKKIQGLFAQNKIKTDLNTGAAASEEKLKMLSGKAPHILHIATHGFFLPDLAKKQDTTGSNTYSLANDPLLRSGLILSGGNYAWSGHTPLNGIEDGIATAYEISQLDLSKTELVVLSACETALGDVKGSEGVFGLQRSFKMAGVKKLIVSLWQVPDKETAELMTLFYSGWLKGQTIESAFYKAQAEMRKKYSPFYWAAFVLVQ